VDDYVRHESGNDKPATAHEAHLSGVGSRRFSGLRRGLLRLAGGVKCQFEMADRATIDPARLRKRMALIAMTDL